MENGFVIQIDSCGLKLYKISMERGNGTSI